MKNKIKKTCDQSLGYVKKQARKINCHKIKFSILTRSIIINVKYKTTLNQSKKNKKCYALSKNKK